jgi:peptide/nickel transport system substrate-binding protein
MRTTLALVLGLALSLGTVNAFAKASNDELKIGLSQEFDSMHPMIATMLASNYLYSLVGRSLIVIDENGKWVPQLARKVPSLENGGAKVVGKGQAAYMQATWEIRDNAKWSDGTPLTCADFKLSLDIANGDKVAVTSKEDYTMVTKIEWSEKTPKKCLFSYKGTRWDFYQIPRFMPMPSHIEGPLFKQYGSEAGSYEKNTSYTKNATVDGIYNGPYKISEIKPGSHVIFVVNPHFYGKAPSIKKIIARVIPDTTSLEANVMTGDIDVIAPIGITFDQALRLEKKVALENLPMRVFFQPSITYEHIDVNHDNPILKDKRVRQALMYGLNRGELVQALFEGKQQVAHHAFAPIDPWYTDDPKKVTVYGFNKKKAEGLLDEAGWKLNSENGLRYKDGQKLSLQLMSTAGNKTRETVEAFLQNQWKEIGIELLIKNEPARVFFGDTVKKRKFSGLAMYAWSGFPEKSPQFFHSRSIPTEKNGWAGRNTMGWSNAAADNAIDQLDVELNPKKRLKLAHEFEKQYSEDVATLSLYYRADVLVAPKNLQNFKPTGHMFSETNKAEEWTVSDEALATRK